MSGVFKGWEEEEGEKQKTKTKNSKKTAESFQEVIKRHTVLRRMHGNDSETYNNNSFYFLLTSNAGD